MNETHRRRMASAWRATSGLALSASSREGDGAAKPATKPAASPATSAKPANAR